MWLKTLVFAAGITLGQSPFGTTSLTPVMMGLGCHFTPKGNTALFEIAGVASNSVPSARVEIQLRIGTGRDPSNGVAPLGKTITSKLVANGDAYDLRIRAIDLTPATQYWFDAAVNAYAQGAASIANKTCFASD